MIENTSPSLGLQPFHAMEILGRAKALEAEGRSICHLEVGEPGVPPAPAVLEAVRRTAGSAALHQFQGHDRTAHGAGAVRHRDQHGSGRDPGDHHRHHGVVVGVHSAFLTAFASGSKIAVTRPGYPAYLNTLDGLGYRAVEIPLTAAAGWRLTGADIEAAHRREPFDGLLFASPANPTGAAVTREGLTEIVETCRRLGVRLISR